MPGRALESCGFSTILTGWGRAARIVYSILDFFLCDCPDESCVHIDFLFISANMIQSTKLILSNPIDCEYNTHQGVAL